MGRKIPVLSFVILTLLLVISCCKKSFDDLYFNAKDIKVKNTYNFRDIGDGITVNQEGYNIKIILNDEIKNAIENINDVRKSLDYCEDNEVALKKKISNLNVSCNNTIWNTIAGIPLNQDYIRIFENNSSIDSENIRLTITEWVNYINNKNQFIDFEWYMEFNEPIISSDYLKFKLIFEVEDGSEFITETQPIKFE